MIIKEILGAYFPVILLVIGLVFGFFAGRNNRSLPENCLRWVLFFAVGVMGIWGGLFQAFEPEMVAASIGWASSPFLFEVACANMGMGIAGLLAPRFRKEYWLAIIIVQTVFLWGAAYGHIKNIFLAHDLAINNAGPILYTDILIPIVLWVLFMRSYKFAK